MAIRLPADTVSTNSVITRPKPVTRNGAHDDSRGGGGEGDADHVARAALEAVDEIVERRRDIRESGSGCQRKNAISGFCVTQNDDQQDRRIERRQPRRQILHQQHPDQQHNRQQEVQAGEQRLLERRQRRALAQSGSSIVRSGSAATCAA